MNIVNTLIERFGGMIPKKGSMRFKYGNYIYSIDAINKTSVKYSTIGQTRQSSSQLHIGNVYLIKGVELKRTIHGTKVLFHMADR